MNPQQDYVGPNHNPYDFIMNPDKPPKKKMLGINPLIGKILMVLLAVFAVLVIVAVALSATAPKRVSVEDLVQLAQTQEEIIRVANQGSTGAVRQSTKNLAITTEFTLKTQQAELLGFIGKQGREVKDKELGLKQDATTDLKLKEAKQTSTYDTVLSEVIEEHLREYAATANKLFENTSKATEKDLLSESYIEAQLLISQVPYTKKSIEEQ